MDIPKFRTEFPEFSDTTVYPNPMIEFWAALAEAQVLACVWNTMRDTGVKLYVAHEITLAAQNKKQPELAECRVQAAGLQTRKQSAQSQSATIPRALQKNAGQTNELFSVGSEVPPACVFF